MNNEQDTDVYNIVANSLWDYLQQIQKGVQQGYVLSDKNACFPQAYISLYTVTLVKEEPEDESSVGDESSVVEVNTVVAEKATEVKKSAGRPKGK